jgi:ISXO2-like transposase domain/Transposase zinc-ribbon domain
MARDKVQFQRGLSDVEFDRLYGTEEKCREALFRWRWPEGFECPACGGGAHCELERRALCQCNACRTQTSLTAGTILAFTKLDLTVWFLAMFHMTQTKQGISALKLSRRLDVNYNTAWKMQRNQGKPLDGRVEMDDAYLGGERSGAKRGRGSPGKMPIVVAVETTQTGKAHRVKLRRVRRFTKKNIKKITGRIMKRGARVVTDGLGFNGVADAGCVHEPIVTGSGRKAARHPAFKALNTVLGNIKSAITATFRSVNKKHAPRRLAAFEYRFNRRYGLPAMIPRLGWVAVRTPPMPYCLLKLAEDHG